MNLVELGKNIYAYCTDFVINLANIFNLSYYEINFIIFVLLYPFLTFSLYLLYLIQRRRLRKLKKSLKEVKRAEITSGGIDGFVLDNENYTILNNDNICGIISKSTKLEIADKFMQLGWSVRKCSFNDFEIEGKWAEFIIDNEPDAVINGRIDLNQLNEFTRILQSIDAIYSLEIYNKKHELMKVITNK